MSDVHAAIRRVERSHDNFCRIREEMHARFRGLVKPHLIDGIVEAAAGGHEGRIGRFRRFLIARRAAGELESHAGVVSDRLVHHMMASRGIARPA